MTDQDPTQRYEPLATDHPAASEPTAPPPIPTAPVTVMPSGRPGRSRARWLVALVVTVLVAGTAAGATLLLTGSAGDPAVLAWVPADSVTYAELRLDLPGSQQAELAKVMRAFPGFDDQAAFPTKLNEALDQLVKRASDDKQGFLADIDPWFSRQLSVSVGPLPKTADAKTARVLLLASVKDGAKAAAWADKLLTEAGATSRTETYGGVTITTVIPPAGSAGAKIDGAYAVLGPVLALGDVTSVKAAIDTQGKNGLATNAQFKTASGSLSGDRLGFAYVDSAALAKGAEALAGGAAASAMPKLPAAFNDLAAPWAAAALRASDGAFVVETRMPHVDKLGPAKAAESKLPAVLPPTTVALVEGHDIGEGLERIKAMAAADPELADGVKQLDKTLTVVGGGFGGIVDWMGEAGIAITRSGDTVGGGLVVSPTDKAAADRLLTQLRGFIALAGGSSGIKFTDEAYGDATITTVDLGNLGALAGAAGGASVPAIPDNIRIAYAVTDQVVVLGYGTDFVKAVLDARTGDSLAKSPRFSQALGRVDKAHGSLLWLDVAGVRGLLEAAVPAADRADYDANTKPYLAAFDSVIGTFTPGEKVDRGTLVIRVTAP